MATIRCDFTRKMAALSKRVGDAPNVDKTACTAVGGNPVAEPWRVLLDNARHGHIPSMARFGAKEQYVFITWELEEMAAYREHGLAFLTTAAQAGEPIAVMRLAEEYMSPGRGTRIAPHDSVRGLAYAKVLIRHADPEARERLQNLLAAGFVHRLDPVEWAKAEALSRSILSPQAEARLEGWAPAKDNAANDFGCGS